MNEGGVGVSKLDAVCLHGIRGVSLCSLLSSKKAFGGVSPKGIHHRHTGVSYWIDPSAASPMCVFDLLATICHKVTNTNSV